MEKSFENCSEMKIVNAKITRADLSMAEHGVLCYELDLDGNGWEVVFGDRVIGKGWLGAEEFTGTPKGIEAIMRIMDTVGVEKWSELKGKYVRVVLKEWGDYINTIGNIIEDKWFDQEQFFKEKEE